MWPIYVISAAPAPPPARSTCRRVRRSCRTLVPREHLPNALSLNTIMFQVAAVSGPALGGIVIAQLGVAWAYAGNARVVPRRVAALLMMRDVSKRRAGQRRGEARRRGDFTLPRRSKGCGSCSARRSSGRPCCWIFSRRSFRRPRRCCRSTRRTSSASARTATAGCTRRPRPARSSRARSWCRAVD